MLSIRLVRKGKRNRPFYRIVVQEKPKAPSGNYIEALGFYDPLKQSIEVMLDKERYAYWVSQGAQPTDTVRSVIKRAT